MKTKALALGGKWVVLPNGDRMRACNWGITLLLTPNRMMPNPRVGGPVTTTAWYIKVDWRIAPVPVPEGEEPGTPTYLQVETLPVGYYEISHAKMLAEHMAREILRGAQGVALGV